MTRPVWPFLDRLKPNSRFARGFALLAGGTAASQAVGLITMPIATRLFGPEAFGVLAVYVSILTLAQSVVGLRYEMAIPLAMDERDAVVLLLTTFAAVAATTATASIAMVLVATGVIEFHVMDRLGVVAWMLPVGILLAAIYQSLRYWAIRDKAYRVIAKTVMSQGLGRSGMQIATGLLGLGAFGLILAEIVGQCSGTLRLARAAVSRLRTHLPSISWKDIRHAVRKEWAFPVLQAPASLVNTAGSQVPTLLLTMMYGTQVAGWYFVGQRIMQIPARLIGTAMGQVFLGEAGELAARNPEKLRRMFNSLARKLFIVALAPALVVIVFGPWLAAHVLGTEWATAGVYLRYLAIPFLFKFGFDALINLAIVRRNGLSLVWAWARLGMTSAAVYGAHLAGWGGTAAVGALAIALSAGYVLKWLFWRHALAALVSGKAAEDVFSG